MINVQHIKDIKNVVNIINLQSFFVIKLKNHLFNAKNLILILINAVNIIMVDKLIVGLKVDKLINDLF